MAKKRKRLKKILLYTFLSFIVLVGVGMVYFYFKTRIIPPNPTNTESLTWKVNKINDEFYTCGNNWLKKNEGGLWEMYVEGDAFERGVVIGKMAAPLLRKQEDHFIGQIKKIIPSTFYLNFLKYFIAWFNRDLDEFIPEEYKLEIYGESFSAPDEYDFIGPKYHRMLNYHAAHDIGHALQDKNMLVGCTSLAVWGNRTPDSSLVIGRNFDFYAGDEFSEDKIVCFFNPTTGNKFMMVSWGGMLGAVSGMNENGLTVTINAGKSDIPTSSATPVSILAREILQYSSTIEEAYELAKKRKTFVAEALMIGSAKDGKTAIIEKSPSKIGLVYPVNDEIVCSNHFQSDVFKNEKTNIDNIRESASFYRFQRVNELLQSHSKIDFKEMADILRDQKGLKDKNIGMGNELAMNQLISHHSIIFKPKQQLVWVSSNPFQLGKYYAYNLDYVFLANEKRLVTGDVYDTTLTIPTDPFLTSGGFASFNEYKSLRTKIHEMIKSDRINKLDETTIKRFENTNPEYFYVYSLLGDYFKQTEDLSRAKTYYQKALTKDIPTFKEKEYIEEQLQEIEKKNKK